MSPWFEPGPGSQLPKKLVEHAQPAFFSTGNAALQSTSLDSAELGESQATTKINRYTVSGISVDFGVGERPLAVIGIADKESEIRGESGGSGLTRVREVRPYSRHFVGITTLDLIANNKILWVVRPDPCPFCPFRVWRRISRTGLSTLRFSLIIVSSKGNDELKPSLTQSG